MQADASKTTDPSCKCPIPQKTLRKGLQYFVMLTIVGIVVIFYMTGTEQTLQALQRLDFSIILLAAILQIFDIWLGGYRNHILLRKIKPNLDPLLTFKAQLANEFGAAVTPGQSGGLPAWLYILKKGGIASAQAMAVSIIVFLSTLFFFELSTSLSWLALGNRFDSTFFPYLLKYGFIVSSTMLICILLSIWMPESTKQRLLKIAGRMKSPSKQWQTKIAICIESLMSAVENYQKSLKHFMRQDRLTVVHASVVTSAYYFGKLNLAYLIMLGLGVKVDYLTAMAVLALLRFVLYFSPTPGGSGVGEISIAALMSTIMPVYMLPLYTILYRAFHLYLPAVFGAWVLFSELRGSAAKKTVYTKPSQITALQNQTVEV